jgi:hypothetical protein
MENMATNRIGAEASGLIKYPIPGKKPPAACRIAVIQEKIETNISFIVFLCFLNSIWDERTSSEIGLKKFTFPPHSKWFVCYQPLYLPLIRGGTILNKPNSKILSNEK